MKLSELYREYTRIYQQHNLESPETEAAYLLADVMGISHTSVPFSDKVPDPAQTAEAGSRLKRRLTGEPYQYICGWTAFRELKLSVGRGCLIPRPETEWLVDLVMASLPLGGGSVCEWGAGSGAICLSLAQERPMLSVCASEISPDAFFWAEKNRRDLGLERVRLEMGDLGSPFAGETFDAVVANLPYIAPEERPDLPVNVRDWEPGEALFADDHGCAILDRALREVPQYLKPGGQIFLEIGETQGAHLLQTVSGWKKAVILPDQYGKDRFFAGMP